MNDEKENTSLVKFEGHAVDMRIAIPERSKDSYKGACTGIQNAWVNFTHVDDAGMLWVDTERLNLILRTTKSIARFNLMNIADENKKHDGEKIYVKGYMIGALIDKFIQEEKIGSKKEYLKYSEEIYKAIRDCSDVEVIREKYNKKLEVERKKLKSKRIHDYKIKYDELTGEKLKKRTAEFAHIRSFAIFRDISTDIENGLIVNKETHTEITRANINDERELLELCKKNNWSIKWYETYKKYFKLK